MRNRLLCSGCLIVFLILSLGIITGGAKFVSELRTPAVEREIPEKETVRLYGQIYDQENKEDYQILYLKNNSIIYQNKSFKESRIILYDEEKLNTEIGNRIEAIGKMAFFEEERNPGNFNQKLYYQKQDIRASVWASDITVIDKRVDKLRNFLYRFRIRWKEQLSEVMGEEDGAILTAMMLGEKSGMNEETRELYQANGIAHILAISGLHLSIIGVGLYRICRKLSGSYLLGGSIGISFLVMYILLIGMSVSVLRALIMFLFRVGADMAGRHYDSPTALSVAAVITIIWKPLYLYDGGFWLSYGAVLAVILVLPVFEELIFQNVWASASITLMTLPVVLYYFYEIPVYSIVLNLIVVPLMTVLMVCGLAGSFCCMLADGPGDVFLWVCKLIFRIYENCCEIILKLPGARFIAGKPEIWQIALYYISLLVLVVFWRRKRKWRMGSLLVAISFLLMVNPVNERGKISVTMLDVGQGDGIFLKGPKGDTYLIDSGSSDVRKAGQYRIETFLKSQGVGKLDYVFLSHGDTDHLNGIMEIIERKNVGVSIETIALPTQKVWNENLKNLVNMAMENGIRVVTVSTGQQLSEGEMVLTCLAPEDEFAEMISGEESNAGSMVLALNYGEFDMLFTGDVEGEGERILTEELKENFDEVTWDILKVAHHGSKNSSANEFLDVVKPAYSLISAGRENSYGHPHAETLERLEHVGSKILSTQDCGAITVETDGDRIKVEGYVNK